MKAQHEDLTGRSVGNWELVRRLGEGAFGGVYEAQNRFVKGRRSAIKVLHPEMSLKSDVKRRFVNEASAASRAEHENIVQVFDGGITDDGLCYVVMELLSGTALGEVLKKGPIGPVRTINVGTQTASALAAAHKSGIVHRDLKPDNIFLVQRSHNHEFVKVLDFGIAKLRSDDGINNNSSSRTKAGMWLGTPPYMSPEQWRTEEDIDGLADIYALGVILYRCLTGRLPFTARTPYEWLTVHLHGPVPDPAELCPGAPPGLCRLIVSMMAKDRGDRPQGMLDVVAALADDGEDPTVVGPPPVLAVPAEAAPPSAVSALQAPSLAQGAGQVDAPPPPPRRRVALVGALAAAAMVVGGTWGMLHPHHLFRASRAPVARPPVAAPAQAVPVPAPAPPRTAPPSPSGDGEPGSPAAMGRGSVLVPLPAGRFTMGSGQGTHHPEGPAHEVDVQAFAIGRQEVGMAQYRRFVEATGEPGPYPWESVANFDLIRGLPVTHVTRAQAERYCHWRYPTQGGRLPTEAEWEYAARGPTGRRFPWGNDPIAPDRANVHAPRNMLLPVEGLADGATPEGIVNLIGNVAEWTAGDAVPYPGSKATIPPGTAAARGGSARSAAHEASAVSRAFVPPDVPNPFIGFRCAATP